MDAIARSGFDYEGLPEPVIRKADKIIEKGLSGIKKASDGLLTTAEAIVEGHELFANHGSGIFGKWVEAHFPFKRQRANELINVYRLFKDCPHVITNLDTSSACLIAQPSCPEAARKEVFRLAQQKPVDHSKARYIVGVCKESGGSLPKDYSPHCKPKKPRKKREKAASPSKENPQSDSESPAKPTQAVLIDARDEQPETTPTQSAPTEQQVIAQLSALVRAIHGLPATEATKHAAKLVDQALETLMTGQVPETAAAPELSVVTPEPEPADAVMTFDTVPGRKSSSATWALTQDFVDELQEAYPGVDVPAQCRKARLWCQTNKAKRKTAKGMPEFLRRWMESAQNSGRDTRGKPADRLSVIDDYIAQYGESA